MKIDVGDIKKISLGKDELLVINIHKKMDNSNMETTLKAIGKVIPDAWKDQVLLMIGDVKVELTKIAKDEDNG